MEESMKQGLVNQIAEVELVYKSKVKASERPKVTHSRDAYVIFRDNWDENKLEFVEEFKVMLLNRSHKVLGICSLTLGNVSGTIADPKLVFVTALKSNASYVIIAHNHPSSSLKPSRTDEELTRKMKEAGKFLDLPLLDHLIITDESYYSFADEGIF
ncbi:MAG: JAB domain-containing protein [Bacteroidota bacterium]|nr:JAB domain-containing protein [Bacteroidota bacterium]